MAQSYHRAQYPPCLPPSTSIPQLLPNRTSAHTPDLVPPWLLARPHSRLKVSVSTKAQLQCVEAFLPPQLDTGSQQFLALSLAVTRLLPVEVLCTCHFSLPTVGSLRAGAVFFFFVPHTVSFTD